MLSKGRQSDLFSEERVEFVFASAVHVDDRILAIQLLQDRALAMCQRGINVFASEFSEKARRLRAVRIDAPQPVNPVDHIQIFAREFGLPLATLIKNELLE